MEDSSRKTEAFIRQKVMEAADEYERELNADPKLADVQPSPWVYESLMKQIGEEEKKKSAEAETLSEEDLRALDVGRRVLARRKRTRLLRMAGLAAMLVLIVTAGACMTSEANRMRLLNAWYALTGQEMTVLIGNEDEAEQVNLLVQEACVEIKEQTGIEAMQFMYLPQGMEFKEYTVHEAIGEARMLYQYGETVFRVDMRKNSETAEHGIAIDGTVLDSFSLETEYGTVQVYEIEAPEEEKDYVAELTYQDCQYTVYGVVSREEFTKIMEKIFF